MIKRFIYRPEFLLAIFLLIISYIFVWNKSNWKKDVMSSDGRGYYSYLPAIFLYQDLTYQSSIDALDESLNLKLSHHCILKDTEGNIFNKCFPGVAVVQLPLFLIATFLSFLFGLPLDGYNAIYLVSITLTGISSAIIGFHFLKKLLISFNINKWIAIYSALSIFLGTNVLFYAIKGASLGHIHSYAAIVVFLYYSKRWFTSRSNSAIIIASVLFGLVFIIRPTNALVILLLPFLAGSFDNFKKSLIELLKNKRWILPTLFGSIPFLILPTLWYVQTGHFVVWSYSDEGFYFTNPKIWSVLFSFRNGLFIYSPLALIALTGAYFIFKKSSFQGIFILLYFIFNVYIISSWWCFGYGGGFGHRAFVEHQIFFGILLAFGVSYFPYRKIIISLTSILVLLSLAQTYQFTLNILPPGYSNSEIYFHTFLKFDKSYIGECIPNKDEYFYGKEVFVSHPILKTKEFEFSPMDEFQMEANYSLEGIPQDHRIYLEVEYSKLRMEASEFNEVYFTVDGTDENGKTISYWSFPLYEIRNEALNEWKTIHLGKQLSKEGIINLKMYVWNKGKHHFKLKDVLYTIKHFSAKDL